MSMSNKVAVMGCVTLLAVAAGPWVSAGDTATWTAAEGALIHGAGAEVLDLTELLDGESRTIGVGSKAVTVTRTGKHATISRPRAGDDAALSVTCELDRDACRVVTFEDDPEEVLIVVEKTRECVNGVGDCDDVNVFHVDPGQLPEGAHAIVKAIRCDDASDCSETEQIIGRGNVAALGKGAIFIHGGPEDGVFQVLVGDSHGVVLRCPEGDASLRVDEEERNDVFLCPKHSVPLEPAGERVLRKRVHIGRTEDD